MGIVEARNPDGSLDGIVEVSLSRSGSIMSGNIMITDTDGDSVFLSRTAWESVVKEVSSLFEKEKQAKGDA
jgi:hypothetical protein